MSVQLNHPGSCQFDDGKPLIIQPAAIRPASVKEPLTAAQIIRPELKQPSQHQDFPFRRSDGSGERRHVFRAGINDFCRCRITSLRHLRYLRR